VVYLHGKTDDDKVDDAVAFTDPNEAVKEAAASVPDLVIRGDNNNIDSVIQDVVGKQNTRSTER